MPINPTRSTKEVYGDNLFADLMDMFLIDEPSDLLSLIPPVGRVPAEGALLANTAIREAASPSANMARKMFGGAKGAARIDDFSAVIKKLGEKLGKIGDVPAPSAGPLDPRKANDVREILMRRIVQPDTVPSLTGSRGLDTGIISAALGEGNRGRFQGLLDDLSSWMNTQIDSERQRTGGQGLF